MQSAIERVQKAIQALQIGKMIILTDHPERENEGDLIIAAEKITPQAMNFMIRHGTGIVCLPLSTAQLKKLDLALMVAPSENTCLRGTQFTVSIDAANGISTGVSAEDRARTVLTAIDDHVVPRDLVKPGHLFPLLAHEGGVLARQGHTEGAIDLMTLAGLKKAAVLCEIMNPDGTMARGEELSAFADQHDLLCLSIDDIIAYHLHQKESSTEKATSHVSLAHYGHFHLTAFKEKESHHEHLILYKAPVEADKPLLVRIHSSCMTGDVFGSIQCDCHQQLHHALAQMGEQGGMLIYLNQEGRGIGLVNKIKTYALQEQGYDTIEANKVLGLPIDARDYAMAAAILKEHGIDSVRLLTNNPDKLNDLKKYGITTVIREPMPVFQNKKNEFYLQTKKDKMHHLLDL